MYLLLCDYIAYQHEEQHCIRMKTEWNIYNTFGKSNDLMANISKTMISNRKPKKTIAEPLFWTRNIGKPKQNCSFTAKC